MRLALLPFTIHHTYACILTQVHRFTCTHMYYTHMYTLHTHTHHTHTHTHTHKLYTHTHKHGPNFGAQDAQIIVSFSRTHYSDDFTNASLQYSKNRNA